MKNKITIFNLLICSIAVGQGLTKRALFLGNSYTFVNNLPQMVADAAASAGDSLIFDSNAPGGYTLQGHSTNATSLGKIAAGNWDYVVLQEQSQLPSFPISQVENDVFPYAQSLDSVINADNSCAETVFYMTWGRKNGDASNCASWPPVCTYSGMDSLLNLRYRMMADSNDAVLSPVGAVWNYIRNTYPLIDLYQADESHPSVAGTYAAACCFYAALFRKDPALITFNSTLSAADAANIRGAAKLIVYDSLMTWNIGGYDPLANFTFFNSGPNQITLTNTSVNAAVYFWDLGDGTNSSLMNPVHTYAASGSYPVKLVVTTCGISDSITQTVNVSIAGGIEPQDMLQWSIYPNPAGSMLTVSKIFSEDLTYRIVNCTGSIIQTGTLIKSDQQIDVSSLSEGIYFLQLPDDKIISGGQKFIKAKY